MVRIYCGITTTIMEKENDLSTSEVGLSQSQNEHADKLHTSNGNENSESCSESEKWRLMFELQSKRFETLVAVLSKPSKEKDLRFPEFDPDKSSADAHAWITTASMCVTDESMQGATLVKALSSALKGSASGWLTQVCYAGMTWGEFKNIFVDRYDCLETTGSVLNKFLSSKPKDGECVAAYAATALTAIVSKCNGKTTEEIAIAMVLAHIAQFDKRVERLIYTADITTRMQLQNELKAVSFIPKRVLTEQFEAGESPKTKRVKVAQNNLTCFRCNQLGHKAAECRKSSDMVGNLPKLEITFYKCHKVGHLANKCNKMNNLPVKKSEHMHGQHAI